MRRRSRTIKESADSRPPCALKFPAQPGWRVVWIDWVEPAQGTVALRPTVGVLIEPVTFWGLEAPYVMPDMNDEGSGKMDVVPGGQLVHLHGPRGERLPPRARVWRVASPRCWMSDDVLRESCREWLNKVYTQHRAEQRERKRRKPKGSADG